MLFPLSDPENQGDWILNEAISDEFEGSELDPGKWFIQGTDGEYYIWKGRAPSQFAPHNVRIEDGKLKIRSQWEPHFNFSSQEQDGRKYEKITTGAVVGKKRFLNGYMEIRSKAGDAAMTSSFWTIGYQSELDMFEQMGAPKKGRQLKENYYLFSIHDWRPGAREHQNKVFTHAHQLEYRVADDFHVYACEWDDSYLKFYEDGNLVYTLTKEEMGDKWVLTNPLEIWFDSEVFPWLGIPVEEELPVDFEIDYVRVWQKPDSNLLDRAFFGFEGPIVLGGLARPEKTRKYEKHWEIDSNSSPQLSIEDGKFSRGRKSLKFAYKGIPSDQKLAAISPQGSLAIPAGEYVLSVDLFMEPGSNINALYFKLDDPMQEVVLDDLSEIKPGEWVTVSQTFSRGKPSGTNDHLNIWIDPEHPSDEDCTLYLDQISISPR